MPDAPHDSAPPGRRESASARFLFVSIAVHLALVLGLGWLATPGTFDDLAPSVPIDLGLVDDEPGGGRGLSPSPAPAPPPPVPTRVARPLPPPPAPAALSVADSGTAENAAPDAGLDAAVRDGGMQPAGRGTAALAGGTGFGFGFGAGGLGLGTAAAPGAMIALHADLARIRASSLVLETDALLELLPGWRDLFAGSGLDPLEDFERVLVASPDLRSTHVVVSARVRGTEATVRRAVAQLGSRHATTPVWTKAHGVETAPWPLPGEVARVATLVGPGQLAIARPEDVPRLIAIGASLAARNAGLDGMERSTGASALLAMRENEAVALSVEGARGFVTRNVSVVPESLRISVRSLDEFHAELAAFGSYENAGAAERALGFLDALRVALLDHPRVRYLGIRSALDEAALERQGSRIVLRVRLTLHQTRYLAAYVRRALAPR